ncbi:MAG: coenzyme F420-0:L-glutamate ligase [Candidatus Doudnabacteria bacterium]|nr:coenzyme F420-0:L-glutamate ligase [Candidatus Doudnabacteria bacterium]
MRFIKVKTRAFLPPKDDIYDLLSSVKNLKDGDVVAITSKVLAVHQGRCIKIDSAVNKNKLIKHEAEAYKFTKVKQQKFVLTVKNHILGLSAGIDESNANGYYVLLPDNVNKLLKEIWLYLRRQHKLRRLGLIATDSHTFPIRRGTIGLAVGFFGFEPLKNYRGTKDIFGRKFKFTQTDIPDALAAMSVFLMGEGSERVPIVVIRGLKLEFTSKSTFRKIVMPRKSDIYYPLLKVLKPNKIC